MLRYKREDNNNDNEVNADDSDDCEDVNLDDSEPHVVLKAGTVDAADSLYLITQQKLKPRHM